MKIHILVLSSVEYDGHTFAPGVHEVSPSVAETLYIRGAVRPATNAEIAEAGRAAVETGAARPPSERADAARERQPRRRLPLDTPAQPA